MYVHYNGSGKSVADVVADWGIVHPVADDADGKTYDAYDVRATPTWALIGADGSLVHRQVGAVTSDSAISRIEALLATG